MEQLRMLLLLVVTLTIVEEITASITESTPDIVEGGGQLSRSTVTPVVAKNTTEHVGIRTTTPESVEETSWVTVTLVPTGGEEEVPKVTTQPSEKLTTVGETDVDTTQPLEKLSTVAETEIITTEEIESTTLKPEEIESTTVVVSDIVTSIDQMTTEIAVEEGHATTAAVETTEILDITTVLGTTEVDIITDIEETEKVTDEVLTTSVAVLETTVIAGPPGGRVTSTPQVTVELSTESPQPNTTVEDIPTNATNIGIVPEMTTKVATTSVRTTPGQTTPKAQTTKKQTTVVPTTPTPGVQTTPTILTTSIKVTPKVELIATTRSLTPSTTKKAIITPRPPKASSEMTEEEMENTITLTFSGVSEEQWYDGMNDIFLQSVAELFDGVSVQDIIYVAPTPKHEGGVLYVSFFILSDGGGTSRRRRRDPDEPMDAEEMMKKIQAELPQIAQMLNLSTEDIGVSSGLAPMVPVPTPKPPKPDAGETGKPKPGNDTVFGVLENPGLFIALMVIGVVSFVIIMIGFIYILCDRRRTTRGEYITNSINKDLDLGIDNPAMLQQDKSMVNGNGAHLVSIRVVDEQDIVPYDSFTQEELMNCEVEDTHL